MIIASVLLGAIAVLLAWPVPVALSRAAWPSRHVVLAMVLWQGIALAGGLSMLGSLVAWGLAPFGPNPAAALGALAGIITSSTSVSASTIPHLALLGAAAVLWAHLCGTLLLTGYRMSRRRRRHLEALRLVAHESDQGRGQLILDSDRPLAYCLPSGGGSITVVTDGILRALSCTELEAVLSHERAHLRQRHDLLIWAFSAWRAALPWLPTSRLALEAVGELTEYLADDAASRQHDRADIARALLVVTHSSGEAPGAEGGAAVTLSGVDPADPRAGQTVRRAIRLVRAG